MLIEKSIRQLGEFNAGLENSLSGIRVVKALLMKSLRKNIRRYDSKL